MEVFVYYTFIYLIEAFILWIYCSNMFHSQYSKRIEFISILFLYTFALLSTFLDSIVINIGCFFICNFIYIFAIFQTKWHTALFHSATTNIIMILGELIAMGLTSELSYNIYDETAYLRNLYIVATLSKILYFIFVQLIQLLFKQHKETRQSYNHGIILLISVPILTVLVTLSFITISLNTKLSTIENYMIAFSSLILLIINIIVFGIYNFNQKKSQAFTELQLQLQKEYDSVEYYKMLNQEHENQSILIHDIKKHLNSIALLNEQGDQERIASYIDRIIHSSDLQGSVRVSDNPILNAILCRYIRKSKNSHIAFRTDIRSGCADFLEGDDLTALFCNLLDNAHESASKQKDGFIEINMEKKEHTAFTVLTMVNSCRVNPFQPGTKKLITSKKDTIRHGFGLKSIKRIIKKYNGDIKMYYCEETCTFHTIIMLKEINTNK